MASPGHTHHPDGAFDGNTNTFWGSSYGSEKDPKAGDYIVYVAWDPIPVYSYEITNYARGCPRRWTVEGSSDGSTWTKIHSVDFTSRDWFCDLPKVHSHKVDNLGMYRFVKWTFFDPWNPFRDNYILVTDIEINAFNTRFDPNFVAKPPPAEEAAFSVASPSISGVGSIYMTGAAPTSGKAGDVVVISGSNITTNSSEGIKVYVGPNKANITNVTSASITVELPDNAVGFYEIDVFIPDFGW